MKKKKVGRTKVVGEMRLRTWAVDPGDPNNNSTLPVISMCIKDDMNQTLSELAERVAKCKCRPVGECLAVLRELKKKGHLGYFISDEESGFLLRKWEPGGATCALRSLESGVMKEPKKRGRKPKLRKWGKEEKAEYARAYYQKNREKILAQQRERYERKKKEVQTDA